MIRGVNNTIPAGNTIPATGGARTPVTHANSAFGTMLQRQIQEKNSISGATTAQTTISTPAAQGINFSKHALARAEERGIQLTDDLMGRLASSVEKAQEKGAKNILAFDSTQAFIINIPYGRVITTMSQAEMRNNIFTNIDGAVLL